MSRPQLLWVLLSILVLGDLALAGTVEPARAHRPAAPPGNLPQWTTLYGGFKHLDDIAPDGQGSAWAVNALRSASGAKQTAFVRLENGVWRVTQPVDGPQLTALAFAPPATGFAVGEGGAIWRWDGTAWQAMASPTTRTLTDVSLAGPTAGWAGGEAGTLLRWDGRGWTRYPLPIALSIAAISSVATVSAEEAWASSLGGPILHFTGSWQQVTTPALQRPVKVALAGPGHLLVAGRGMLELVDGAWQSVGDPNVSYRSATWVGEDAYVVGNDRLLRYHAGALSPVTLDPGPGDLSDKRFEQVVAGPGGAWAIASDGTLAWLAGAVADYLWPPAHALRSLDLVGDLLWTGGEAVTAGYIGRRGNTWLSQADPGPGGIVWDLDLISDADGWSVSQDPALPGSMAMRRWDGRSWNEWPVDKTWLLSRLQMLSAEDGWAAGGNLVARWRGRDWEQVPEVPLGASGPLSMLRGGDDPLGWFGSFGEMIKLVGAEFSTEPLVDRDGVRAVDMVSAEDGWAVTPGAIFHYDGSAWQPVNVSKPTGAYYRDVDAAAADDVWALLDPPGLMHWTGLAWEYHDLGPLGGEASFFRLRALRDAPAPVLTDVWLAGAPPAIAHYRVLTPTTQVFLPSSEVAR